MRIAYAGFDLLYPALQALVDDGHEIIKIYSCKTDNVCEFNTRVSGIAKKLDIPITYHRITAKDLQLLKENGCEALITAGYYYRIPIDDGLRMINIHPALLPIGRGAWPMPVTILNGIKKSGVTIHKMEESFDTGEILMQREFDVAEEENLVTFMDKVYDLIPEMIRELCSNFSFYYDNAKKQGKGEYWECPDESKYVITPETSFREADRILRAFMGYECRYSDGEKIWTVQYAKAVKGENINRMFPIRDGYILTEKIREL